MAKQLFQWVIPLKSPELSVNLKSTFALHDRKIAGNGIAASPAVPLF